MLIQRPCQRMQLTILGLMILLATIGCDSSSKPSPLPSGSRPSSPKVSSRDANFSFSDLIGNWTGSSYRGSDGSFHPSSPRVNGEHRQSGKEAEKNPMDKIDFLLEINQKYLSIKGVESCHLTLSYGAEGDRSSDGTSRNDAYRLIADDESTTRVLLHGSGGQFEVTILDNGELTIQGKIDSIGKFTTVRRLTATLKRIDTSDAGSDGAAPRK